MDLLTSKKNTKRQDVCEGWGYGSVLDWTLPMLPDGIERAAGEHMQSADHSKPLGLLASLLASCELGENPLWSVLFHHYMCFQRGYTHFGELMAGMLLVCLSIYCS